MAKRRSIGQKLKRAKSQETKNEILHEWLEGWDTANQEAVDSVCENLDEDSKERLLDMLYDCRKKIDFLKANIGEIVQCEN